MNAEMIKKISDIGFEVREISKSMIRVSSPAVPSVPKVLSLFSVLGPEDEIYFWNYYHNMNPRPEDPGAYLGTVICRGAAYYRESGSGWESNLYSTSLDDMAGKVIASWDKNINPEGLYANCVYIRYNPYPYRDLRTTVFFPDIKFDGWMNFADRMIFTGAIMMLIGFFFLFARKFNRLSEFLVFFIIGAVMFFPCLYMRIQYNRTSVFWRWQKKPDKKKDYRIVMTLNGQACELNNVNEVKSKLDEFYRTNGKYDIEVTPPMAGIAAYSAYYDSRRDLYNYTFRTITDDKVTYRYFACRGRSREDLIQISRLIKRKRISLKDYGFEKSWEWDRPMIEEPRL